MIIFRSIDEYDRNTGKKIGTRRVYDHEICDFTGERITDYENPNAYEVDYCSNDPCFGDAEGERWLYGWFMEKYGEDACAPHHELFAQRWYKFKDKEWEGYEVFGDMLKVALEELSEIYSLDHLLRWSRGRMLERVIKEGKYKLEDFLEEEINFKE